MKIEFRKIPTTPKEFKTSKDGLELKGILYKESQDISKIEAVLSGKVEVECIRCASKFGRIVNEEMKLIVTDKIYNGFDDEFDVIEIDSQIMDFDDIIMSEIESIKLDFENICNNCKDLEKL